MCWSCCQDAFEMLSNSHHSCTYLVMGADCVKAPQDGLSPFDRQKMADQFWPRVGGHPASLRPLRPIRLLEPDSQVRSHLARHQQYCRSAHTSWKQTELPQDTVKKKHQYFIKLLSLSGPDQSIDSHSPTGRDGSFVFAPQVGQQSDSVLFWKPCTTQLIHLTALCLTFWKRSWKERQRL